MIEAPNHRWDLAAHLRPSTRFDLHMHSTRSDGRHDPADVLLHCARGGLDVVALTDHDLGSTLPTGWQEVDGRRLFVLGGAEISGVHDGREHHLLVYFPRGDVPPGFQEFCRAQCRERAERYTIATERLGLADLSAPEPLACSGDVALTRMHLARDLVTRGHAKHIGDAFSRYLGDGRGFVPAMTLPLVEAIRIARSFGGITSWAHPPVPAVERYLAELAAAGLQGIEALRPHVNSDDRRRYREAARRFGLFLTGGSDWHGWGDDGVLGLFRLEAREIPAFVDVLLAA